jgi:hypothetical protein
MRSTGKVRIFMNKSMPTRLLKKLTAILAFLIIASLTISMVGCKPQDKKVNSSKTTSNSSSHSSNNDSNSDISTSDSEDSSNPNDSSKVDPGSNYPEDFNNNTSKSDSNGNSVVNTEGSLGTNVYDYGAIGDGKADDTEAFKATCEMAARDKSFVMIPSGTFRLTSTIALNGISMHGYSVQNWPDDKGKLPTIVLDHRENGLMMFSAGLSGVHIVSTQNVARPAIRVNVTGCRVSNVYISNVGAGIRFKDYADEPQPGANPGRSNVENVYIENCTKLGLYVSGTQDVPFVKNVTVVSNNAEFTSSGVGIKLTQNDDIRMSDCMVSGASIAYQITDTNPFIEQALWGSLDNCSADKCKVGIQIESGPNMKNKLCAPVTFTGGTINASEEALTIAPSRVQYTFNGTSFLSSGSKGIEVNGGEGVLFTKCKMTSSKSGVTAVAVDSCKGFVLSGCTIKSAGAGVLLNASNISAIVTSNTVTTSNEQVINKMTANSVVKDNIK